MYVPLNISITNQAIRAMLLVAMSLNCLQALQAQGELPRVVEPQRETRLHPLNIEIGIFAGGGSTNNGKPWESSYSSTPMKHADERLWTTDVSLGTEGTFSWYRLWSLTCGMGYQYCHHAFDWGFFGQGGMQSHWLTTDIRMNCVNYFIGMQNDILLSNHVSNASDMFSGDCLNKHCMSIYVGVEFALATKLKLQGRFGYQLKRQMDADRLAYYSMQRSKVKGEFVELRLCYSLFTTKNVFNTYSNY